jgi:hypothetical protein
MRHCCRPGSAVQQQLQRELALAHADLHFRLLRHDLVQPLTAVVAHMLDCGGLACLKVS